MAFLVSSATLLSGNSRVLLSITGISNFNPFPNNKFRLSQTERVCRRQFLNLMIMADSSPNR